MNYISIHFWLLRRRLLTSNLNWKWKIAKVYFHLRKDGWGHLSSVAGTRKNKQKKRWIFVYSKPIIVWNPNIKYFYDDVSTPWFLQRLHQCVWCGCSIDYFMSHLTLWSCWIEQYIDQEACGIFTRWINHFQSQWFIRRRSLSALFCCWMHFSLFLHVGVAMNAPYTVSHRAGSFNMTRYSVSSLEFYW